MRRRRWIQVKRCSVAPIEFRGLPLNDRCSSASCLVYPTGKTMYAKSSNWWIGVQHLNRCWMPVHLCYYSSIRVAAEALISEVTLLRTSWNRKVNFIWKQDKSREFGDSLDLIEKRFYNLFYIWTSRSLQTREYAKKKTTQHFLFYTSLWENLFENYKSNSSS